MNYGGRVTDDFDRRLTNVYVAKFFCEEAVKKDGYRLSSLDEYYIPDDGTIDEYRDFISTLPASDALLAPPVSVDAVAAAALRCAKGSASGVFDIDAINKLAAEQA